MALIGGAVAAKASTTSSFYCSSATDITSREQCRGNAGGECTTFQSARNGIVAQSAAQAFFANAPVAREKKRELVISAKIRKGKKSAETEYPWPEKLQVGNEMEGSLAFLSRFKPLPNKPKPVTLPFERPIVDLQNKIDEVFSYF